MVVTKAIMTLFKQKYRVESTRLKGWDYTAAGYYYVTICTKNRDCFFGEVIDDDVRLSIIGGIVAEEWLKTEEIRPNVKLDEWIVMPNHMHAILIITHQLPVQTLRRSDESDVETFRRNVSTHPSQHPSRLQSNSLGSIIGQFKSVCTKRIWTAGFVEFGWQARFYDRILWDEKSLQKARQYIANNPLKWNMDRDNPAGLYM
jgi:REP element-mobilizing transposase RayT